VICCEPLAHAAAGTPVSLRGVWAAEVVAGSVMAFYVVAEIRRGEKTD